MTESATNMQRYVVDASVVVKWLNQDNEDATEQALTLLEGAVNGRYQLLSPDLLVHEVLNALVRGKRLKEKSLEKAVDAFFLLPVEQICTSPSLASAAAAIAETATMSFYDALYVALAYQERLPLLTANARHQEKSKGVIVIDIAAWRE